MPLSQGWKTRIEKVDFNDFCDLMVWIFPGVQKTEVRDNGVVVYHDEKFDTSVYASEIEAIVQAKRKGEGRPTWGCEFKRAPEGLHSTNAAAEHCVAGCQLALAYFAWFIEQLWPGVIRIWANPTCLRVFVEHDKDLVMEDATDEIGDMVLKAGHKQPPWKCRFLDTEGMASAREFFDGSWMLYKPTERSFATVSDIVDN